MDWLRSIAWRATLPYLAVLAIVVGAALLSPHHDPYQTTYSQPQYEATEELSWGGMAEITAAIFTGVLAFFAFMQVRDNRLSNERQLRAYLGITTGSVAFENFEGSVRARVTLRVKNYGKTPAYEVTSLTHLEVAPKFDFAMEGRLKPTIGKGMIFPDDNQRISFPGELNPPSGNDPLGVFVIGKITYRDAFRHERWLTFRFTAHFKPGFAPDGLVPEDEGNDAN